MSDKTFGLIRTNPKLSSNIKIVCSDMNLYLDTIEANSILSNIKYKKYSVNKNSNFADDIGVFLNGEVSSNTIFDIKRETSDKIIYDDFKFQYEKSYEYGCEYLVSNLYDEKLKFFAPIWIGKDRVIPENFVIFRIDGARSEIDTNLSESEDFENLESSRFSEFISKSNIIKVFKTKISDLGTYINNTIDNTLFPNSPIFVDFVNKTVEFRGIDINTGNYRTAIENISDLLKDEQTVFGFDKYITSGFERNDLICANIFNIEYIFDDPAAEDFKTYRYFGFYCDNIELSEFNYDKDSMFNKTDGLYKNPYYESNFIPDIINEKIEDPNGIKIKIDVQNDFKGIVLTNSEIQERNSFFYIIDGKGNYHKINNNVNDGANTLTLNTKSIKLSDLLYFDEPFYYDSNINNRKSKSSTYIEVLEDFEIADTIDILYKGKLLMRVIADTLIEQPQQYGVGDSIGYYFYPSGDRDKIATAIANSLNYGLGKNNVNIRATAVQNFVVVYSMFDMADTDFRISVNSYTTNKIYSEYLIGGSLTHLHRAVVADDIPKNVNTNSYIKVENGYSKIKSVGLYLDEPVYNSQREIVDFKNFGIHRTLNSFNKTITHTENSKVIVYNEYKPKFGVLNLYGISDFDFSTFRSDYNKSYKNEYDLYFKITNFKLEERYILLDPYNTNPKVTFNGSDFIPISDPNSDPFSTSFVYSGGNYIEESGRPFIMKYSNFMDEEIRKFRKFHNLGANFQQSSNINELIKSLYGKDLTEYDRLDENSFPENSLESKIVPYVAKFVLQNSKDVRNNDYRLNINSSFGVSNFSPSFDNLSQNIESFTHEWYYLSGLPEFISKEDLKKSESYMQFMFDEESYKSRTKDYFTEYFVKSSFIYDDVDRLSIIYNPIQYRYTEFTTINQNKFSTIFRGANLNVISKNLSIPISRFSDYKFSAVMNVHKTEYLKPNPFSIKIIENKKFKNLVLLIDITIDDYKMLGNENSETTPNYSLIYILNSLKRFEQDKFLYGLKFDIPKIQYGNIIYNGSQRDFFRGVQLSRTVDYSNVVDSNINSIIPFSDFLPISYDIKNINAISDLSSYSYSNTNNSFGRLWGFNKQNIVLTTEELGNTSGQEYIDITNQTTILNIASSKKILLSNSDGLGVVKTTSGQHSFNISPFLWNNQISRLSEMVWVYENGGYQAYSDYMKEVSFAGIKNHVNDESDLIKYYSINEDSSVSESVDFKVVFTKSDKIELDTILKTEYEHEYIVGMNETSYNRPVLKNIPIKTDLYRYSGEYTMKFKNLFEFVDDRIQMRWNSEISSFNNLNSTIWYDSPEFIINFIWINVNNSWGDEFGESSWSSIFLDKNTINQNKIGFDNILQKFNTNISETSNMKISDYFYHRVNRTDNSMIKTIDPTYPSISELCIDKKDFNILSSNLEPQYFTEFLSKTKNSDVSGLYSSLNKKSFLGSYIINQPPKVIFKDFVYTQNNLADSTILSTTFDIEYNIKDSKYNFNIDLTNKLISAFKNPIKTEFLKFINPNVVNIDEFVEAYIKGNILNLYKIQSYIVYTKKTKSSIDIIINDSNPASKGYTIDKNFFIKEISNLNNILSYNNQKNENSSFSFEITIGLI